MKEVCNVNEYRCVITLSEFQWTSCIHDILIFVKVKTYALKSIFELIEL